MVAVNSEARLIVLSTQVRSNGCPPALELVRFAALEHLRNGRTL